MDSKKLLWMICKDHARASLREWRFWLTMTFSGFALVFTIVTPFLGSRTAKEDLVIVLMINVAVALFGLVIYNMKVRSRAIEYRDGLRAIPGD